MSSRIIGAELLSGVRRFQLSDLDSGGGAQSDPAAPDPLTDDPAFKAGHLAGHREGFALGAKMAREQAARDQARLRASATEQLGGRATQLAEALSQQFAALEQSVADELVELAIELARQTVRRTLAIDRDSIVIVVQEAVAALLDERASFAAHLNPSDVEQVGAALGQSFAARGGRVVPDAAIAAGGCRIVAAGAEIDATVATRWRRVLASIGREVTADDALTHG